mmetsp:Transcript_93929/g.261459  ORF Transcript_93929/g.261459 Transcript_93929/m.261459 type:complete len:466 (-) Transcript_93929:113-1510(-)
MRRAGGAACSALTWRIHGLDVERNSPSASVVNIQREDSLAILRQCGDGNVLNAEGCNINAGGYGHRTSRLFHIDSISRERDGSFSASLTKVACTSTQVCDSPQYEWDSASLARVRRHAGFGVQFGVAVGELASSWAAEQLAQWQSSVMESLSRNNEASLQALAEVAKRGAAPIASLRGFAFEIEHARSFNEDAISKGLPYRAVWPGLTSKEPSDINIVDTRTGHVVSQVQCKASDDAYYVKSGFADSKYDGMQKVTTSGTADKVSGASDKICYGGASSCAESTGAADERVKSAQDGKYPDYEVHKPEPSTAGVFEHAAGAALKAGAMGGVLGGVLRGAMSACQGNDRREVAKDAGRGALQSGTTAAASSFASTAVTESMGDAVAGATAGAVVGATVGLMWQLERCSHQQGNERTRCNGTAWGGATGGLAGATIGQMLIPIPIVGGLAGGMVGRMLGGGVGGELAK